MNTTDFVACIGLDWAEGKEHQVILRALAFKWIRIVYSCWKNKTPYDETKYLLKMRERGNVFVLPK